MIIPIQKIKLDWSKLEKEIGSIETSIVKIGFTTRNIPFKYSYLGGGASRWIKETVTGSEKPEEEVDDYYQILYILDTLGIPKATYKLKKVYNEQKGFFSIGVTWNSSYKFFFDGWEYIANVGDFTTLFEHKPDTPKSILSYNTFGEVKKSLFTHPNGCLLYGIYSTI